jgi:hypothetical protein
MLLHPLLPVLVIITLALATSPGAGQGQGPGRKPPTEAELRAALRTPIDTKPFNESMNLKDCLALFQKGLAAKDVSVPIVVDRQAFRDDNPDAPDFDDHQAGLVGVADRLPAERVLRVLLGQVRTKNATIVIRPGFVEITTVRRAEVIEGRARFGISRSGDMLPTPRPSETTTIAVHDWHRVVINAEGPRCRRRASGE